VANIIYHQSLLIHKKLLLQFLSRLQTCYTWFLVSIYLF